MPDKFIDVKKVIKEKNPTLLKWLPGFVISYIRNVIHEDWLNEIMGRIHHLKGMDFVDAVIDELKIEVVLKGAEHIPKTGGVIIAANHPLGGIDGIALMYAVGKIRKDIRFLVNDLLMSFENFQPMFVPVNKLGKNSQKILDNIDQVYAEEYAVMVFPAGLVSRKSEEGIRDLIWKKSFVTKSKKYKKNIIPCFIEGKNSKFFYNLANWRKKIGIQANIEMFYLADEMYQQQGKKVTIHFGEAIPYQNLDSSKTDAQWALQVKELVYKLGKT
ncbi:1-acyl-sn-glycerol-3-phosphate acyltransferase [Algoriphagus halophilus]|uniref:Acyltransferase n=1 Tax=Algoriphagus halophilus TaxID=226505 RepID=A0A1N6E7F9_9BACT|nr:1-acyl-sn-glycerol-3-phosphate acyltransferase [Algoriphagus halophilus]SIN78954.1 Acyltransferase [Algoriphagus halophilus]